MNETNPLQKQDLRSIEHALGDIKQLLEKVVEIIGKPKNEAYKGRNICPKCKGDIDALNSPEAFHGTWTCCEGVK